MTENDLVESNRQLQMWEQMRDLIVHSYGVFGHYGPFGWHWQYHDENGDYTLLHQLDGPGDKALLQLCQAIVEKDLKLVRQDIVQLARKRNRLKHNVNMWMKNEGLAGRLRTNDQAPMWREYEEAETLLANALHELGQFP